MTPARIVNYPMGGTNRPMIQAKAHHSHAVQIQGDYMDPLCRVKLSSLCLDDSVAEPEPTCPSCRRMMKLLPLT